MNRTLTLPQIIIVLLIIMFVGLLLFKHFIIDRTIDESDMRNPDYVIAMDNAPTDAPSREETTK